MPAASASSVAIDWPSESEETTSTSALAINGAGVRDRAGEGDVEAELAPRGVRAAARSGPSPTTRKRAPSHERGRAQEALGVLDRDEPADEGDGRVRAALGGRGRRDAVVDHVRVAEAQVLGDDDDLVGGAGEQPGRARPVLERRAVVRGQHRRAARAAAEPRRQRRRSRSPSCCGRGSTCGRKARTKAASRAVHSATPSGERPRSGRTRRRARSSASSGPAAPETATSWPRAVRPCASATTTRSAPPRAMPGLASRILTGRNATDRTWPADHLSNGPPASTDRPSGSHLGRARPRRRARRAGRRDARAQRRNRAVDRPTRPS